MGPAAIQGGGDGHWCTRGAMNNYMEEVKKGALSNIFFWKGGGRPKKGAVGQKSL